MRRRNVVPAIALGVALLSASGRVAATSEGPDVRDFAEVQASEIVVTPDPGGRSAVLEVETTLDMACSVVYGPDESFGLIAVDDDMAGGGHSDHQPVLGGLEPDTVYHYRMQGTAPDGTIYVSEVGTFTTPPAPVGGAPNLALEATVTGVSSEFSEAFAAENAFDGDATTAWSSAGDGDDAWVEIDLGEARTISEVVFRTRSMGDGSATAETFSVTADGVELGTFPVDSDVRLDVEARRLRFDVVSSSGGNTGAIEILVLGEPWPAVA